MNKSLFFLIIALLKCCPVFAEDPPTTPFNIIGYIQSFKLCDPNYNTTPCNKADPRTAATIKVNGINVIIPANLKIIMPGTYLTAQDILKGPKGKANSPLVLPEQSGLALEDSHPPGKIFIPFTAEISGNMAKNTNRKIEYIAGLINIAQGVLQTSAGYIHAIDYAKGELHITPDKDNATNLVRVRLNDPVLDDGSNAGRFSQGSSGDKDDNRFMVDQSNPTVHAMTGYPVCIPKSSSGDERCPMSNRPKGSNNRYLTRYTIGKATPTNINGIPVAGAPICTSCKSDKLAPLVPGDYVIYAGIWLDDPDPVTKTTGYISAYALEANLGIYTSPGETPAYVAIEESLWGTGGIAFPGIPQETGPGKPAPNNPPGENLVTRFKIVGFTTDPSRVVELVAVDVDPMTGEELPAEKQRVLATVAPEVIAPMGRFEETVEQSIFLPPTREIRAQIKGVSSTSVIAVANGLKWGQYTAPVGEYLFPEGRNFGASQVPMNFENLCFIAKGAGPLDTLGRDKTVGAGCPDGKCQLGQLQPWPESGHGVNHPQAVCNFN
jgi:hypothetical protein